jgi:hypothetical protein
MMSFTDSPTHEAPALKPADVRGRGAPKVAPPNKADQTAEVSIDDLGLDLDHLEQSSAASVSIPRLEETDHPSDAPTMVAGLDERSRRMMAEAENRARDRDLTELERELEASFVADLGADHEEIKTAVLGPESAPTVQMPRAATQESSATSRFKSPEFSDIQEPVLGDLDSTSKLRGINADSIDLDLDRLANALGMRDSRAKCSKPVSAAAASILTWAMPSTAQKAPPTNFAPYRRRPRRAPARSVPRSSHYRNWSR